MSNILILSVNIKYLMDVCPFISQLPGVELVLYSFTLSDSKHEFVEDGLRTDDHLQAGVAL